MITYDRRGKEAEPQELQEGQQAAPQQEEQIPIDGFAQVVDMLRVADPEFRESILKNIERRDPDLAYSIKKTLLGL